MVYLFIFLGAVVRVLPHLPNFTPIGAIALFGGSYLSKKQAFFLPLLAMIISDYFIGFDSIIMRVVVYGSFVFSVGLGMLIKKHKSVWSIFGGSLLGSVIFYLTTNFAWFYGTSMYTHDFSGVISSYINALPFFRNTLMGDLFFVGVFFGSYELICKFINSKHENIVMPKADPCPSGRQAPLAENSKQIQNIRI